MNNLHVIRFPENRWKSASAISSLWFAFLFGLMADFMTGGQMPVSLFYIPPERG
jgi:hypothetical protein